MHALMQSSAEACTVCAFSLQNTSTKYLPCSSRSSLFVSTGVLDFLLAVGRVNDLFGGPRLQTDRAGANWSLSMLMSGAISLKLSSFSGSLLSPPSPVPSYPKMYSGASLKGLERKSSQLISESLVNGCAQEFSGRLWDPTSPLAETEIAVSCEWGHAQLCKAAWLLSLLMCFQTHLYSLGFLERK